MYTKHQKLPQTSKYYKQSVKQLSDCYSGQIRICLVHLAVARAKGFRDRTAELWFSCPVLEIKSTVSCAR
jgi:hypothetical protein